ncbi:MAG: ATP-binding cassette domain-containing protein [Actinomycetota bacterium]|jgi:branched-chain amino acid transport system ATP-binding protein
MILCQTVDLGISFGAVHAVEALNLRVHRGEIVALIGPNGAGKTTVLNCLSGFYLPDRGRVELDGMNLRRFSPNRRAHLGIGRTFQTPQVFRSLTVAEHLELAVGLGRSFLGRRSLHRRSDRGDVADIEQLIELTGLAGYAATPAGALPLGLARRLEIGRALALNPRLLLLDEPASGMEEAEGRNLGELILDLRNSRSMGILLVEHDMGLVGQVADYVYVLDHGRLLARGDLARVQQNPEVIRAYLGGETRRESLAVG